MGFINLPTLLQRIRVDTKDMIKAARQADTVGDEFDKMSDRIDKSSKDASKSTKRLSSSLDEMQDEMRNTSAATKSTVRNLFNVGDTADEAADEVRELGKELRGIRNKDVKVDIDLDGLERAQKSLKELEKSSHNVRLDVQLDKLNGLNKALKDAAEHSRINIEAEIDNVEEVQNELDKIANPRQKRQASFMARLFRREKVEKEIDELTEDRDVDVDLELDSKSAAKVAKQIKSITDDKRVKVDIAASGKSMDELLKQLESISSKNKHIKVKADTAEAAAEIKAMLEMAGKLSDIEVVIDQRSVVAAETELDALARDRKAEIKVDVDKDDAFGRVKDRFASLTSVLGPIGPLFSGMFNIGVAGAELLYKAVGKVVDFFKGMGKSAEVAGQGVGVAADGMKVASGGAGMLAKGGYAAAAGLAAISTLLPILVTGLAALLANIVSVTGALTFGLLGSILPLIPALGALAAGFGTLMVAIKADPDFGKKLKKEFEEFTSGLKSATAGIRTQLTETISTVLDGLGGLIKKMAPSVTNVLKDLNSQLSDSTNRDAFAKWGNSMPRIFESLGKAVNNVIIGLTHMFVPILPYAEKLAEAIRKVTERFAEWAKSAEGQKSISDFMKKAWEDAKNLWGILTNVSKIFWELLTIGEDKKGGGGATFLEKLKDKTEEWLKVFDDPKKVQKIKDFFRDAKESGEKLLKIIDKLADALDKMVTEENIDRLDSFLTKLDMLMTAIGFINKVLSVLNPFNLIFGSLKKIGELLSATGLFDKMKEIGTNILEGIGEGLLNFDFSEFIQKIVDHIVGWFKDKFGIHSPSTVMRDLAKEIPAGIAEGIVQGAESVWEAIKNLAQGILDFFMGLPGQITSALGDLLGPVVTWLSGAITGAWNWLIENGGVLLNWFIELPGNIISSLGDLLTPMVTWISGAITGAWNWLITNGGLLLTWFTELPGKITSGLGDLVTPMVTWLSGAVTGAWNWLTTSGGSIVQWFSGLPGRIINAVSGFAGMISTWAVGAATSAWTSLSTGFSNLVTLAAGLPGRIISAVSSFISSFATWASNAARGAWSSFTTWFGSIVTLASGLPGRIIGAVTSLISRMTTWASSAGSGAWRTFSTWFSSVVTLASGLPGRVIGAVTSLISSIAGVAARAGSSLWTTLGAWFNNAVTLAAGLPGRIAGAIGDVARLLWNKGWSIAEGFFNGIKDGAARLGGGAVSALKAAVTGPLGIALQINSPSKVMIPYGSSVSEGFALGIDKGISYVDSARQRVIDAAKLVNPNQSVLGSLQNSGASIGESIADGILSTKDIIVKAMMDIGDALDPQHIGISDKFATLADQINKMSDQDVSSKVLSVEARMAKGLAQFGYTANPEPPERFGHTDNPKYGNTSITVKNYNPVAEKSSQSTVRILARLAALGIGELTND